MICENCNINPASEQHHLFSQSRLNKRLYPEYIHHPDNILHLCHSCHHSKPLSKWSEAVFCGHFGIKPRSKTLRRKKGRVFDLPLD
jgi:hypothetical protein